MRPMLRSLISAALFALVPAAPLQSHVDRIVHARAFAGASFGIAVYDLDRRRMTYAKDADKFFLAASTTKLLTEGASLAFLGPNYRFHTTIYRNGYVDADGTLHGDAILRASGDPNLSGRLQSDGTLAFENEDHSYDGSAATKAVPGDPLAVLNEFAQQIYARGIRRIDGRVVVDDSLYNANFAEPGTGAVVSPIVVNDNIIDVVVRPGAKSGDAASFSVSPRTSYASFVNAATTCAPGAATSITLQDGDPDRSGAETVTIGGCIARTAQPTLYAYDVPSPRRFAEMALTDALARVGVEVGHAGTLDRPAYASLAASYSQANAIAEHVSAPLAEDVKVTLKVSDNLHADAMPYLWAHGDSGAALRMEQRWLAQHGVNTSGFVQNDGLGGDAYIEPQTMVEYLAFLRTQPFFGEIRRALPVLGRDGTLFDIQLHSPAVGHVYAKTGTWSASDALNGRKLVTAKGLAGYMTTRTGRHLAFCFYVNNVVSPARTDGAHLPGEALGAIASAIYEDTP